MLKEIQEITKESNLGFNNSSSYYNLVKLSVFESLKNVAKKGKTSCIISIDYLVNKYMSPKTSCHKIYIKLKEYFEKEGFICEYVVKYKETYIKIEWKLDAEKNDLINRSTTDIKNDYKDIEFVKRIEGRLGSVYNRRNQIKENMLKIVPNDKQKIEISAVKLEEINACIFEMEFIRDNVKDYFKTIK
jgi:hypothetical protein